MPSRATIDFIDKNKDYPKYMIGDCEMFFIQNGKSGQPKNYVDLKKLTMLIVFNLTKACF